MRRRILSVVLLAILSLGSSACMGFTPKTVVRKDPPQTLIAADGSFCVVGVEQFKKQQENMKAVCRWQGGGMK